LRTKNVRESVTNGRKAIAHWANKFFVGKSAGNCQNAVIGPAVVVVELADAIQFHAPISRVFGVEGEPPARESITILLVPGKSGGLNGSTQHFLEVYSQESENLRHNFERNFVFGVEPSNVGLLRTDFELIVGILLNAFDPSCEGCI